MNTDSWRDWKVYAWMDLKTHQVVDAGIYFDVPFAGVHRTDAGLEVVPLFVGKLPKPKTLDHAFNLFGDGQVGEWLKGMPMIEWQLGHMACQGVPCYAAPDVPDGSGGLDSGLLQTRGGSGPHKAYLVGFKKGGKFVDAGVFSEFPLPRIVGGDVAGVDCDAQLVLADAMGGDYHSAAESLDVRVAHVVELRWVRNMPMYARHLEDRIKSPLQAAYERRD